jgi:hypothetical protein
VSYSETGYVQISRGPRTRRVSGPMTFVEVTCSALAKILFWNVSKFDGHCRTGFDSNTFNTVTLYDYVTGCVRQFRKYKIWTLHTNGSIIWKILNFTFRWIMYKTGSITDVHLLLVDNSFDSTLDLYFSNVKLSDNFLSEMFFNYSHNLLTTISNSYY